MATNALLRALTCLCLLTGTTLSMPSFDHGSFDDGSLLRLGGSLTPSTGPIEIRGVYGGQKKRYILEREEAACSRECREKPICLPTLGEIVKDCKCQKCGTGIPALDGNSCQDDCPDGTAIILKLAAS
jgi:hypothetical protein